MNKKIITITIIIIIVLVSSVTIYKVLKVHNERLITVEEKHIIEVAKQCVNEKKCSGSEITLQTLYDLEYLERASNPVTKEFYNPESYVLIEDSSYTFIIR